MPEEENGRPAAPQARLLPGWARVLLQSALVALFVLAAYLVTYHFHAKLAMASLAASGFIAFGFPGAESARPRYLIGGYLCGTVSGLAGSLAYHLLLPPPLAGNTVALIAIVALAVFLTALLMFGLNLQHPPAAALAICVVLEPQPLAISLTMIGCILALCGARWAILKLLGGRLPGPGPAKK